MISRLPGGRPRANAGVLSRYATYGATIDELKAEGRQPADTEHRQLKSLNNVVKTDHGKFKQLIRPVRHLKMLPTAFPTIKRFGLIQALRKGQASAFNLTRDMLCEMRMVERALGVGARALANAVAS